MTGKTMDNRAGAAVLVLLAEKLGNMSGWACSILLLFSASEEIGERGAKTACYQINPDIAKRFKRIKNQYAQKNFFTIKKIKFKGGIFFKSYLLTFFI